ASLLALDARAPPDLDAPLLGVVHQEDERLRVLRQVVDADVLPVALEVVERERLLVEHPQEALRPAAVLDVGLAVGAGGGEIERVALRDELAQPAVDFASEVPGARHGRYSAPVQVNY